MPKKQTDEEPSSKPDGKQTEASSAVFDVSKPGSTPASPTSRPIIVGHQSMMGKDPLLAKDQPDNPQGSKPKELKLTKQKKISPLNDEAKNQDTASDEQDDTAEKTDATEPAEEDTSQEKTASNSSAAIDALAGEVDAKAQAKQQSKADAEKSQQIQALAASKKYHLPITEGGKKAASERVASWLLIFLLLASAGAWLAIDAGYLDIGIDLPFDLIKN